MARCLLACWLIVLALPAQAREALDYATMTAGRYRDSVDLSAYAPGKDAKPPTHRFEGRLRLSDNPSSARASPTPIT